MPSVLHTSPWNSRSLQDLSLRLMRVHGTQEAESLLAAKKTLLQRIHWPRLAEKTEFFTPFYNKLKHLSPPGIESILALKTTHESDDSHEIVNRLVLAENVAKRFEKDAIQNAFVGPFAMMLEDDCEYLEPTEVTLLVPKRQRFLAEAALLAMGLREVGQKLIPVTTFQATRCRFQFRNTSLHLVWQLDGLRSGQGIEQIVATASGAPNSNIKVASTEGLILFKVLEFTHVLTHLPTHRKLDSESSLRKFIALLETSYSIGRLWKPKAKLAPDFFNRVLKANRNLSHLFVLVLRFAGVPTKVFQLSFQTRLLEFFVVFVLRQKFNNTFVLLDLFTVSEPKKRHWWRSLKNRLYGYGKESLDFLLLGLGSLSPRKT